MHVYVLKHHCTFWPIFCSFPQSRTQVFLKVSQAIAWEKHPPATCRVGPMPHRRPFLASAGINTASPPYPRALRVLNRQPGRTRRGEERRAASSACSYRAAGSRPARRAASKARGCACSFFQHSKAVPLQV